MEHFFAYIILLSEIKALSLILQVTVPYNSLLLPLCNPKREMSTLHKLRCRHHNSRLQYRLLFEHKQAGEVQKERSEES